MSSQGCSRSISAEGLDSKGITLLDCWDSSFGNRTFHPEHGPQVLYCDSSLSCCPSLSLYQLPETSLAALPHGPATIN